MSGVTATGTTIADAYVISRQITVFSSVPSGTGCVLPSSYAPGSQVTLCNRDATNALTIYPPKGDRIEVGGVDVPTTLAAGSNLTMVSFDAPLAGHPRTWWETTFFNLGPYLPISGGTMVGELIINNPSGTSLDARHDVLIGGTLGVTGATTLSTVTVSGAATLSGNATVGGTLGVTGAATLSGGGTFTGTFAGNPTLSGNVAVGGTLGVTGAQSGSTIDLTGAFNTTTTAGYKQSGSTVLTMRGTTQQSTLVGLGAGSLLPSNDTETTAIGWNALAACTGATLENTAVGWGSLRTLTTGFFNTAVGVNTGGLIVTDTDNALFGTDVMRDSTGGHNVAVGNGALRDGVHNQNVAIGHLAMTANGAVTANTANNVAVGYQTMSGASITTASNNVMVGYTAGQVMTTGTNNTGVGSGALNRLTSGVFNATVGRNSLVAVTTGFNNAALGFNAGASITTGASNLVLGPAVASTTLATGTGNILIGVTAAIDTPAAGTSNTFALGNHATNLMRATAINTAAPAFFLDWLPGSTTFANDAAAAAGGVAVGQVYRNGSAIMCRIT